jgi:hypothetical protein
MAVTACSCMNTDLSTLVSEATELMKSPILRLLLTLLILPSTVSVKNVLVKSTLAKLPSLADIVRD